MKLSLFLGIVVFTLSSALNASPALADVEGWWRWRGPEQNGRSTETTGPTELNPESALWHYPYATRGAPVIANGRLYLMAYRGEGAELVEILACLDAVSGEVFWELEFPDFLSDIVYNRYAIGSPVVDPESGWIYAMTAPGLLLAVTPEGEIQWEHSMMEQYGRLSFPNGRTGSPIIEGNLVIVHGIMSNWGAQGPARDRFYAFDKESGDLVWASTPGTGPIDSSYSTPIVETRDGRRIFYAGLGCGNVVAVDARTGEPIWRFPTAKGGVNVSPVIVDDVLVSIHNLENIDTTGTGRMIGIDMTATPEEAEDGSMVLPQSAELWRNDLSALSSSPVVGDGVVYQVTQTGELAAVDPKSGEIKWTLKLAHEQLHASPLLVGDLLYVPLLGGEFYIFDVSGEEPKEVGEFDFETNLLGAPVLWQGRLYVPSNEGLYCFATEEEVEAPATAPLVDGPEKGEATGLLAIPAEVIIKPGESVQLQVFKIDDAHNRLEEVTDAEWETFIPPTAKVKATMDASFTGDNTLTAAEDAQPSAGAWKVTKDGLSGTIRGRVLADADFAEDFETYEITETHPTEEGVKFAYPPLPWIGGRFKWEVREVDGEKVLAKTLDRYLFQRATTFIGAPGLKDYIVEADLKTEGKRRQMSTVGVINQRYVFVLDGNKQQIEVFSNFDRFRASELFRWKPDTWYRLKTMVETKEDGSGIVKAKAWPREEEEPEEWNLEAPVKRVHQEGAPGLFGFTPQNRFRVYVDNLVVKPATATNL